jgi:hypothetical protein
MAYEILILSQTILFLFIGNGVMVSYLLSRILILNCKYNLGNELKLLMHNL